MINIALCNNNQDLLKYLFTATKEFLLRKKIQASIKSYCSSSELLYDLQDGAFIDIFILDIGITELNGLSVARFIQNTSKNSLVIFLTSQLQYALVGYELGVFRYIPLSRCKHKLEEALNDAITEIKKRNKHSLIIQNHNTIQKILFDDIAYLTKEEKYTIITTTENEKLSVRASLSNIYSRLDPQQFAYIDKGCIVNVFCILSIEKMFVRLMNGITLQISRSKLKGIKTLMLAI